MLECNSSHEGVMSRTHRIVPTRSQGYRSSYGLRRPKTTQEIKQNQGLLQDIAAGEFEYDISGVNRLHRHIAHANDDIVASSIYQQDYKVS